MRGHRCGRVRTLLHDDRIRLYVRIGGLFMLLFAQNLTSISRILTRRGHASYASRDNGWLFPGGRPGRHLLTENFRGALVDLGIRPHSARYALFALATEVPHMILAQALGISHTSAITWVALAARDWSGYIPHRAGS